MLSRYTRLSMLNFRERASTGRFEIRYRNQGQDRAEKPP